MKKQKLTYDPHLMTFAGNIGSIRPIYGRRSRAGYSPNFKMSSKRRPHDPNGSKEGQMGVFEMDVEKHFVEALGGFGRLWERLLGGRRSGSVIFVFVSQVVAFFSPLGEIS